jgi:hypothetical protein
MYVNLLNQTMNNKYLRISDGHVFYLDNTRKSPHKHASHHDQFQKPDPPAASESGGHG